MPAWEALETVIQDKTIWLVADGHRGETKGWIDRAGVWVAAIEDIYVRQVSKSRTCNDNPASPGRGRPTVTLTTCVKAPARVRDKTTGCQENTVSIQQDSRQQSGRTTKSTVVRIPS